MRFSFPSFLLLVLALVSCVFASPIKDNTSAEPLLASTHQLAERSLTYPIKCNDAFVAKVMTSVKADLYAKVFGSITGTFCEQTAASIQVKAVLFGGIFKIGDAHLKAIQSAAVKNLKASFDAELRAQLEASIYDKLEVSLKKSLGTTILDSTKFLSILKDFETKAKALIKVQLPKVGASLTLKAKNQIDAAINDVEVNVPLVAQITISVGVNAKTTINTTIKVAIKACAKLDAKASALAVLKSL